MPQKFSPEALRVLDVLGEQASDGYTVMSKARLTPEQLVSALKEIPTNLVMVKGELIPDRAKEAFDNSVLLGAGWGVVNSWRRW